MHSLPSIKFKSGKEKKRKINSTFKWYNFYPLIFSITDLSQNFTVTRILQLHVRINRIYLLFHLIIYKISEYSPILVSKCRKKSPYPPRNHYNCCDGGRSKKLACMRYSLIAMHPMASPEVLNHHLHSSPFAYLPLRALLCGDRLFRFCRDPKSH